MATLDTIEKNARAVLYQVQVDGITDENFDVWLRANHEDKAAVIARNIQDLTETPNPSTAARIEAFLRSVFWLRQALLVEKPAIRVHCTFHMLHVLHRADCRLPHGRNTS